MTVYYKQVYETTTEDRISQLRIIIKSTLGSSLLKLFNVDKGECFISSKDKQTVFIIHCDPTNPLIDYYVNLYAKIINLFGHSSEIRTQYVKQVNKKRNYIINDIRIKFIGHNDVLFVLRYARYNNCYVRCNNHMKKPVK